MKKLYVLALSALFGISAMAQVSVTFQVDMNDQTVSENGVHIAGDWQAAAGYEFEGELADWQPGTSEMTEDGTTGIYTLEVDIPAGQYEYKFVNGNDWDSAENVPSISQRGGGNDNRVFVVTDYHADNGFDLPAVMYGGSAPAGEVAVRLEVDMVGVSEISENGVHVAGEEGLMGESWNEEYGAMFSSSNSKYAYVANVAPDATYAYKYINGNDWDFGEWPEGANLPEPGEDDCIDEGNRTVEVGAEDVSLDAVCYESCSECELTEVTLRVNLSNILEISPEGVHVAGDFQGWNVGGTELTDVGDNIYEVTLWLGQGSYQYKFINGNAWGDDESIPAECNVDNNRELVVGEEPMTVEFCYNQCTTECAPYPAPSDITFRVNMADETVSPDGVWVIGSFTDPQWQTGAIQMSDLDEDGVYEVTVEAVYGPADVAYKFVNGLPQPEDPEGVEEDGDFETSGCGVASGVNDGSNRTMVRTDEAVILDLVCYESCDDCVVGLEENVLGEVSIFPNPSNGTTYIEVQNPNNYTLNMSIVDITGKTVRENVVLNATVNEVNTTNLNAGLYFLNIVNEHNDQSVYKLMVR